MCFNHEIYLKDALDSVVSQNYKFVEIIIVNDCSTDDSDSVIQKWISNNKLIETTYINNSKNLGNTQSFNKGLNKVKGEYIIDLATDDILLPNAIEDHLKNFESTNITDVGVSFANVELIDYKKTHLGFHYDVNNNGKVLRLPKSGNLYNELLASYYLNPTGMFVKKEVYDLLRGYDETLDYEDFDFWIRSSHMFNYIFCNSITIQKRIIKSSHSYLADTVKKNKFTRDFSTYKVCLKAYHLNSTKRNFEALWIRILHEFKQVTKSGNYKLSIRYFILYLKSLRKYFLVKK